MSESGDLVSSENAHTQKCTLRENDVITSIDDSAPGETFPRVP